MAELDESRLRVELEKLNLTEEQMSEALTTIAKVTSPETQTGEVTNNVEQDLLNRIDSTSDWIEKTRLAARIISNRLD